MLFRVGSFYPPSIFSNSPKMLFFWCMEIWYFLHSYPFLAFLVSNCFIDLTSGLLYLCTLLLLLLCKNVLDCLLLAKIPREERCKEKLLLIIFRPFSLTVCSDRLFTTQMYCLLTSLIFCSEVQLVNLVSPSSVWNYMSYLCLAGCMWLSLFQLFVTQCGLVMHWLMRVWLEILWGFICVCRLKSFRPKLKSRRLEQF